jgi:hypothetical protein
MIRPLLPYIVLASAVACVSAIPARAQTPQSASVEVALTANPEDWHHEPSLRIDRRTPGLSMGIGAGTVRFEAGWPIRVADQERRTFSLELLYVRRYQLTDRVALSGLAGGGYALRRRNHPTVVGGLDLEVAAARRTAIIVQLRVRHYPLGGFDDSCCGPQLLTVEPRIGLRWQFY